jgi:hypothetical protein
MSIYNQVMTELDESTATWWGDTQPYYAINNAQIEVAARCPQLYYGTATITCTAGQEYLNHPSTIMVPQHVLDSNSRELPPTTPTLLQDHTTQWRNQGTAAPASVMKWDSKTFRLWPKAAGGEVLRVVGVQWPTEITTSAQSLTEQPQLQTVVALIAASTLLAFTQPELAQYKRQQAEEFLARLRKNLRLQGGQLRLIPGSAKGLARSGGSVDLWRRP